MLRLPALMFYWLAVALVAYFAMAVVSLLFLSVAGAVTVDVSGVANALKMTGYAMVGAILAGLAAIFIHVRRR